MGTVIEIHSNSTKDGGDGYAFKGDIFFKWVRVCQVNKVWKGIVGRIKSPEKWFSECVTNSSMWLNWRVQGGKPWKLKPREIRKSQIMQSLFSYKKRLQSLFCKWMETPGTEKRLDCLSFRLHLLAVGSFEIRKQKEHKSISKLPIILAVFM